MLGLSSLQTLAEDFLDLRLGMKPFLDPCFASSACDGGNSSTIDHHSSRGLPSQCSPSSHSCPMVSFSSPLTLAEDFLDLRLGMKPFLDACFPSSACDDGNCGSEVSSGEDGPECATPYRRAVSFPRDPRNRLLDGPECATPYGRAVSLPRDLLKRLLAGEDLTLPVTAEDVVVELTAESSPCFFCVEASQAET